MDLQNPNVKDVEIPHFSRHRTYAKYIANRTLHSADIMQYVKGAASQMKERGARTQYVERCSCVRVLLADARKRAHENGLFAM